MNQIEIAEKTPYEEIYDNFLKSFEKDLKIKLSNKVKEKNYQLFQTLSNYSWDNLLSLWYYLFERNYVLENMLWKDYIWQYSNKYKDDIRIWKILIWLYFIKIDNQIMIDRVLFIKKTTFIWKKMDKIRNMTEKLLEKWLVWEWI